MTAAEIETILEEGGAKVGDLILILFSPDVDHTLPENQSKIQEIFQWLIASGIPLGAAVQAGMNQQPAAIVTRVIVGALDRADDELLPLIPSP